MRPMSRRAMLRGLGGAALALPALEVMTSAHAQESPYPKRLVLFHFGNGAPMKDWTPAAEGVGWPPTPILEALGTMAPRVDVVSGLSTRGIMQGLSGNVHGLRLLASVTTVAGATNGAGEVTGAGGPSFDQLAAQHLGAATPFSNLVVAAATRNDNPLEGRVSWSGVNSPVAPIVDPLELYQLLFTGFDPGDDAAALLAAERRASVLDYVKGAIDTVKRDLGAADRARLEEHLASVRELEKTLDLAGIQCTPPASPGVVEGLEARSEALLQLVTAALSCDLTRVVSFSLGPTGGGPVYDFLGLSAGDHDVSHGNYLQDSAAHADYLTMTRWKLSRFGRLLELLATTPEGDGALLDSCIVVCMSEMSDGNGHNAEFLPVLAAGGGLGGRHHVHPCRTDPILDAIMGTGAHCSAAESTPLGRLWLTALRAAGVEVGDFGNAGGHTLDGLWLG